MSRESIPRTLLVATAVALTCSVMVSAAVHFLRPMQAAWESLERSRAILAAAGLMPEEELADGDAIERYLDLDARVIDLETDWFAPGFDAHRYDPWTSIGEAEEDTGRPRYLPVYVRHDGDGIDRVILPVSGKGMWSTIYAYLALEADLDTIADIVIYGHGETPGIGDKIEEADWRAGWQGKTLHDDEGTLRFQVKKNADGSHEVDAISGATITTQATGRLVRDWLGDDGFGPFLENLADRGLSD